MNRLSHSLIKIINRYIFINPYDFFEIHKNKPNFLYRFIGEFHNQLPEKILEKYIEKIDWYKISRYSNKINFIERHIDKVIWSSLSLNDHLPIEFINDYHNRMEWIHISTNPAIIHSFEKFDKIGESDNYLYNILNSTN